MKKYLPFNSKYLPNFQVVEQRDGNISRFPHTVQLPKLLRALNMEFSAGLPDKIVRVDHRASDLMKIQRHMAVLLFCSHINRARRDDLRLRALMDPNMVARVSIVQQITDHTELGQVHRFKFYAGDNFFTDIYLNRKRIAFAGHAIERFEERVPNHIGTDLTNLFDAFFGSPVVVMECNNTPSFVFEYDGSLIAFPIRTSTTEPEYFLPTCLSGKEINQLELILPPPAYTPFYDSVKTEPQVRNWDPIKYALLLKEIWKRNEPLKTPEETAEHKLLWSAIGHIISDKLEREGHGEGSRILFRDNIPGHGIITLLPGQQENRHVEMDDLKRYIPDEDWEKVVPAHKAANPEWYGGAQASVRP